MLIAVELGQHPRLENFDDFKELSIRASGAPGDHAVVAASLTGAGAGEMADMDHAFILPSWLIAASGRGGDEGWRTKFEKMLEFAAANGWVSSDGVRAHIVWTGSD